MKYLRQNSVNSRAMRSLACRLAVPAAIGGLVAGPLLASGAQASGNKLVGWAEAVSQSSGKCLDVAHASKANGAPVIQYTCHDSDNQQWIGVSAGGPNTFYIKAKHSGKCLDVAHASKANGAQVIQYTCHEGVNQQWKSVEDKDHKGFYLVAKHSGKCLDVAHASTANGARVIQYTCHHGLNQLWR